MNIDYIGIAFKRNDPKALYAFVSNLWNMNKVLRLDRFEPETNPGRYVFAVKHQKPQNSITFRQIKQINDAFKAFHTRPSITQAAGLLGQLEYIASKIKTEELANKPNDEVVLTKGSAFSLAIKPGDSNARDYDMTAEEYAALQRAIIEGYIIIDALPVTEFFQQALPHQMIEDLFPKEESYEEIPYAAETEKFFGKAINVFEPVDAFNNAIIDKSAEKEEPEEITTPVIQLIPSRAPKIENDTTKELKGSAEKRRKNFKTLNYKFSNEVLRRQKTEHEENNISVETHTQKTITLKGTEPLSPAADA